MPEPIVVIGAGVIGLSTALRLQSAGHPTTILARDLPAPSEAILDPLASINYSSPWAGAHNRWVPPPPSPPQASPPTAPHPDARDHAFALETYAHMEATAAAHPAAGITFLRGLEYLETPPPPGSVYAALDAARAAELGLVGFRLLDSGEGELPAGVAWGCEYRTWCANPMVYCAWLLRRFVAAGGSVVRGEVRGVEEVFGLGGGRGVPVVGVVVNCSGIGFGDPNVFVTRGQTCLVRNPCDVTITRQNADGTWTFVVPRGFDGGTIIGGTKEPDNWGTEPSPSVRAELLSKLAATYPSILAEGEEFDVIRDIVGRRPTRKGGIRIEAEKLGEGRTVVHAYGLGGRGYELSWGVAGAAFDLVKAHCP